MNNSAAGDASSTVKKGLLALGITASTTLLSYVVYKYWKEEDGSEGSTSKQTKKRRIPNYSLCENDVTKFTSWKVFENKKLGLSFRYPARFTATVINNSHLSQIQLLDEESMFFIVWINLHVKDPSSPVIILISVEENVMNFDAAEYSQQNVDLLKQQSIGSINILQEQPFITNGHKGVEILFDINGAQVIKAYIASIAQESKCYMVQHLVPMGSGANVTDFDVQLIRDILKTLNITKPTDLGKAAIRKKNGVEITFPSLFYTMKPQSMWNDQTEISIVRYHKDDVVKEITVLNMGENFEKEKYLEPVTDLSSLKEMLSSITISGFSGDIITYDTQNWKHIDVIVQIGTVYYVIACKCKEGIFEDFKTEALLAAKSFKLAENSLLKDELRYENFEYKFSLSVPPNQIVHQFSHHEPIVSFVSPDSDGIEYSKLTIETMVSAQKAPEGVLTTEDVKNYSKKLLEEQEVEFIKEFIGEIGGKECYTSIYNLTNSAYNMSLTFMVTSILHSGTVFSISNYTLAQAYDKNVEQIFHKIQSSFNLL